MDVKDFTLVILAFVLIFIDKTFSAAKEKNLIVFPKPFFSSNVGANIQLLKNQHIIGGDAGSTPSPSIASSTEAKNCSYSPPGTTDTGTTDTGTTDTNDYTFGWSSWNESRYLFVQINKTWDDAKEACHSHDKWAHLVFIESDAENDFIIDLIDRELAKTCLSSDVWLGLIHVDGEWKWDNLNTTANLPESGSREIRGGDASTSTQKVCARISRSRNNRWHDKRCSKKYFFVCETRKVE